MRHELLMKTFGEKLGDTLWKMECKIEPLVKSHLKPDY